jgi:hypothetical protein
MNAAPSLAPSDFPRMRDRSGPQGKIQQLARARQHRTPPLRCITDVSMAKRGSKQQAPKRGASTNARDSIAGQSTAQK